MKTFNKIYRPLLAGLIAATLTVVVSLTCVGCNKNILDTSYTFEKAIVYIGGEWREVEVKKWTDFDDGDQIQIETKDGYVYLVHSCNITLIHKK